MGWHFDMFEMDRGRAAKPWQRRLYRFVNYTIPNIVSIGVLLAIVGVVGWFIYAIFHFIWKYW